LGVFGVLSFVTLLETMPIPGSDVPEYVIQRQEFWGSIDQFFATFSLTRGAEPFSGAAIFSFILALVSSVLWEFLKKRRQQNGSALDAR
jgi:hypothetical protein